mmetsp:Transcript_342/g.907  ORF Transcript_342/g.907 Transcript_342/m.907 type:complete len:575 (+) Transcript_342:32-1756(+)
MERAPDSGFQGLLRSQLSAIQQVLSLNQALARQLQPSGNGIGPPEDDLAGMTLMRTRTDVSQSPLTEPLLPQSPTSSPDNLKAVGGGSPSSAFARLERSPGGLKSSVSLGHGSLRNHALQFGSRCRRAATRLNSSSLEAHGLKSISMSRFSSRPILQKPKEIRTLAKSVLDNLNNKDVQDPEKLYSDTGVCQAIARSAFFKNFTLAFVVLSTFWIAIDTDYNRSDTSGTLFLFIDNVICAYFVFEITIRWLAYAECRSPLSDYSFLFDLFLAVCMAVETWGVALLAVIFQWEHSRSSPGITPSLRALRLIRITRAFRMSRVFRFVPELMILLHGMFQAIRSVLTTLLLLVLLTYTFAVAMTQLLQNKDIGNGRFDNVPQATYFLLLQTLCGFDLHFMLDMVNADPVSFAVLLGYELIGSLTLMNMLTGVMVDVVGTTAQLEQEEQSLKTLKRDIADVVSLTDENKDQTVTSVEFTHMIQNPEAVKKLYEGGVNVVALIDYADFVFRDTKTLSLEDFVETVLQFRGSSAATVKDVVDLRVFVSKEIARLDKAEAALESRVDAYEEDRVEDLYGKV